MPRKLMPKSDKKHPTEGQYSQPSEVVSQGSGDDLLVINLLTGDAFRLNSIGAEIWQMATAGAVASDITERLHGKFEAARAELDSDVTELLEKLVRHRLLLSERT